MIEVLCECGHKLVIFPHHAGTSLPCPKCKRSVKVPGEAPPKPKPGPVHIPTESFLEKLLRIIRGG